MGNDSISRFAWDDLSGFDPEGLVRTTAFSGALTATPSASLHEVIARLEPSQEMILLRDEDGPVTGLITREWLEHATDSRGDGLADLLRAAEQGDRFVPRQAPPLRFCDDGKHYTNACPCSDHPASSCH